MGSDHGAGLPQSLFHDLVVIVEVEEGPSFRIDAVGGAPVTRGVVSPAGTTGILLDTRPDISESTITAFEAAVASKRPQRYHVDRPDGSYEVLVTPIVDRAGNCTHLVMHIAERRSGVVRRRDMVNAAIVDAIPGSIALLDAEGVIRAVNAGWIRFGLEHSHDGVLADAGTSYLDITDAASNVPGAAEAARAIRGVLDGDLDTASSTYEALSDEERSWYTMRVAPVEVDDERWAVVIHEDVTELRDAQARWQRAEGRLELHRHLLELVASGTPLPDVALAVAANIGRAIDGATGAVVLGANRLVPAPDLPGGWLPFSGAPPPGLRQRAAWAAPVRGAGGSVGAGVLVLSPAAPSAEDEAAADLLVSVLRLALQRDEMRATDDTPVLRLADEVLDAARQRPATEITRRELRRALHNGEIVAHYQPIVDLNTAGIAGLEALVRWLHPQRGPVPPPVLIHAAEATGLIDEVGRLVLDTACADLARWHAGGMRELTVAVNLSATQLADASLVDGVRRALERNRVSPGALVVEITESVVVEDIERVAATLHQLRTIGVQIAIDDFGTGYSSLLYLKRLPADVLKVDRAFVEGLGIHAGDTAIVDAVVGLGHQLGLEVVAEGVETPEQLLELRRRRCDYAQGFLLQPPAAADVIDEFLARGAVDIGPSPAVSIEVGAFVSQLVEDLAALHAQHRVRLTLPDEPVTIDAEPAAVRQILTTLVANAVRRSTPGTHIDLAVRADGGGVEIAVIDHGTDDPASKDLHLCQALARRQGGDLGNTSTPGGGTTFTLRLA